MQQLRAESEIVDPGTAPFQVHLVHVYAIGATASQFMLAMDPCNTALNLGETHNFPVHIGTFTTGVSISYQSCLNGTIPLGFINFFGLVPDCCYLHVVPDPNAIPAGEVWTVDCTIDGNLVAVTGGEAIINSTSACHAPCNVPSQQNSWGQIKSLYE